VIDAFDAHQQYRGFSPATRLRRRKVLTRFARHIAPRTLFEADANDIEAFVGAVAAAASRRAYLSDLKQFYRWARRRDLCITAPTDLVDPPKLPRRHANPLTSDELRRLLDAASPKVRLMVMLAAYAGLRCAEIAAIHTDDIDHVHGLLIVRGGKGGKDGILPLAPALATVLVPLPAGRVVGTTAANVGQQVRRLYDRIGIVGHRPHDLRATFGTEAARRAGGNMRLVQKLMRHDSVVSTEYYIAWDPDGADVLASLYQVA
jgi:integrase/recombinase XerD